MKCPKCGYEIDSSSQYCMNCGAKKPKKEKKPFYKRWWFWAIIVAGVIGVFMPEPDKSEDAAPTTETVVITETTIPETTEATTEPTTEATTESTAEATTEATEPTEEMVWIPTGGGTKYHSYSSCSNMSNPSQVPLSKAVAKGFTACKRCY